jgi:hypothetical protein
MQQLHPGIAIICYPRSSLSRTLWEKQQKGKSAGDDIFPPSSPVPIFG